MQEIHRHPKAVWRAYSAQTGKVAGYLTAEEWKGQCLTMADEIFDRHEQGLL